MQRKKANHPGQQGKKRHYGDMIQQWLMPLHDSQPQVGAKITAAKRQPHSQLKFWNRVCTTAGAIFTRSKIVGVVVNARRKNFISLAP